MVVVVEILNLAGLVIAAIVPCADAIDITNVIVPIVAGIEIGALG